MLPAALPALPPKPLASGTSPTFAQPKAPKHSASAKL
jgi:hypothetical protein